MATAKTQEPEYDFDSWTDEDDEKAIAALVPDVRHIIVEGTFIGRFTDGQTVRLPLSISLDEIDRLSGEFADPVDQVKAILTNIGGEDEAKKFGAHDLVQTIIMAKRFFDIFQRIAGASLPES